MFARACASVHVCAMSQPVVISFPITPFVVQAVITALAYKVVIGNTLIAVYLRHQKGIASGKIRHNYVTVC